MGRRALHHWPRMRALALGDVQISGSCYTMPRWAAVRAVCRLLIVLVGLALIAAGSVEHWGNGQTARWLSGWPSKAAWDLRYWLHLRLMPTTGLQPEDFKWAVVIVGVLTFVLAEALSRPLAALFSVASLGMLKKRFAVRMTPEWLYLSRWWGRKKLARGDVGEGQVQARVVPPEEYFSRYSVKDQEARHVARSDLRNPPAVVEIVQGFRRHKMLMTRRTDEAEAIVLRINEALLSTM